MKAESHDELVRFLVSSGAAVTEGVRAALKAVDRAAYLRPDQRAEAYYDAPVILKRDRGGRPFSTVSQPTIVALMLEQLAVRPGDRVLEIGTASGYNAALLAHLAGDDGFVVTVEIDDDLAAAAAERLADLHHVRAVAGDGRRGYPPDAPYDGIVVTAGAPRVEAAWVDQLVPGGRLVVPITGDSGRGTCFTYERTADGITQVASMACGFVPLR